ncbi:MAG: tetratricopeptide repeat protein [Candidatus Kariarchaeaceae archaeon]|jgi:tetratricopeptide (TPR) repeat protein
MQVDDEVLAVKQLLIEGRLNQAQYKLDTLKEVPEVLLIKSELASNIGDFNAQYFWAKKVLEDERANFYAIIEAHYFMALARLNQRHYELSKRIVSAGFELLHLIESQEETPFTKLEALFHYILGVIAFELGKYDQSLIEFQRSLFLGKIVEDYLIIASNINKIADVFDKRGKLKRADELYKLAYYLFFDQKKKSGQVDALLKISEILTKRGEIDKALEIYMNCLELTQILGNTYLIAQSMGNVGAMYFEKGDYHTALIYLSISIQHAKAIGNDLLLSTNLLIKGKVLLKQNSKEHEDQLEEILSELRTLAKNKKASVFSTRYMLFLGLTKKNSPNFKYKGEAKDIFLSIINTSGSSNMELAIEANINTCDILIQELIISNDDEVLEQAIQINTNLIELSEKQNRFGILIDTLILKSKLVALQFDYELAEELLIQADDLAELKGYSGYKKRTHQYLEEFRNSLEQIKRVFDEDGKMRKRIEELGIEEYLQDILKAI